MASRSTSSWLRISTTITSAALSHCEKAFRKIGVEQVWLSWLDDPRDRQARKIGKAHNNLTNTLFTARAISARDAQALARRASDGGALAGSAR